MKPHSKLNIHQFKPHRIAALLMSLLLLSPPLQADTTITPALKAFVTSSGLTTYTIQEYSIPELGLKIRAENEPPWEVNLSHQGSQPILTAQSPENYHPSTAMTFTAFPKEKVATAQLPIIASSAIERASQNFGLTEAQANTLIKTPAQYGILKGYESNFHTQLQGTSMDVKIFVGQAEGKYPVALSIYTLAGKMPLLSEVIRRSWGKLAYL